MDIKKLGHSFTLSDIENNKDFDSYDFMKWLTDTKKKKYYTLTIEMPNILYLGFFLFTSNSELNISNDLVNSLFESISNLLQIGHEKITSRYLIENILSSIPDNVLIFDYENFQIRYVNDMFVETFSKDKKKKKSDMVGSDFFTILPFDAVSRKNIASIMENAVAKGISDVHELNLGTNIFEYSLFNITQFGHDQRLIGIILTDVTEAKYFQQKLLLNEKLLALGKVASGIAHEINNPLYAVLANAEEIAENKNLSEDIRDYADEMIDHVMNVSNIIRDLSTYSKTLRKEISDEIDINSVINESLKLVRYGSNFLEIDVETNLSSLSMINAAKGEIQQIFINLFNNAIQAMKGKGILQVSSEFIKNNIIIKITDSGCGIEKDIIKNIFDLYFTTKSPGEGTGQGLHIVKKIISMYNGTINVKSEVGKGTTFTIVFNINKSFVEA
jgi:signal transduction histidine kinase